MSVNNWWQKDCQSPDLKMAEAAQLHQNQLTKPQGALGELETVAISLAALQGRVKPAVDQVALTVFAADHGVAAKGVSAYPQEVTGQMVLNFASGGAAVTVLAKQLGASFEVVNLGTVFEVPASDAVICRQIAPATAPFDEQSAMTEDQLNQALKVGAERVEQAMNEGAELFVAGEMGIGNTSAATALAASLLKLPVEKLAGPGTGVAGEQLQHKLLVIQSGLELHKDQSEPVQILRCLGGFEIAAMTGAYIRAAQLGLPVLVDGFISTVAALVAVRMQPQAKKWMLFGHQSAEPGHQLVLSSMEARPLLRLDMRLGEGSGAALAVQLLRSACLLHNTMATFDSAGVSDRDD